MRALVQRVAEAEVTVDGELVGSIGAGLCVLVGVTHDDTESIARRLAGRLAKLRVFNDDDHKMNRSVVETGGQVMVVSQFTLYADTRKGNRPGYSDAALPDHAEALVDIVAAELRGLGIEVATGRFGADMDLRLHNQGPVTIQLEIDPARTPD